MTTSEQETQRVLRLLRRDLTVTVGDEHDAEVSRLAANAREFSEPEEYAQKVVDEVQQYLHDTFVDTTWPTCPRHSHHPLWYRDGEWWCERDGVAVAALGELGSPASTREGPVG